MAGAQFTGHERDTETGLDYMFARYYSAGLGRFLSVDPSRKIDKNLENPQRWNRYAYSLNNPVKYFDPDGRDVQVAANARSAVQYGYQNSGEFRGQFDAAKNNPNVQANLTLSGEVVGARAVTNATVTGPVSQTVDAAGQVTSQEFKVEATVEAPAAQGDATTAALFGHELAHVNNMSKNGPEVKGTPAADAGQQKAQASEKQIKQDFNNPGDNVSADAANEALKGTEPKNKRSN